MKELKNLLDDIARRVSINLREIEYDVEKAVKSLVPQNQLARFYAFYGISSRHGLGLEFRHSNLGGSYFLGRCNVSASILYKSDVRGDELKRKGDLLRCGRFEIRLSEDELIEIEGSMLVKTLVHNFSHDPESPGKFFIHDSASAHYSNIHGSPCDGCFLEPFATLDLTTARDCVVGAFSYVQAGEVAHKVIPPGTVWVHSPGSFDFLYRHDSKKLAKYIEFTPGAQPKGELVDIAEDAKRGFDEVFDRVHLKHPVAVPRTSSVDRYASVDPNTVIGQNVLVAQRALLSNAKMGKGANAQENCCVINSILDGENVTAHGAKVINAHLGRRVFSGFNSLVRGLPENRVVVGDAAVIMPHTIIDAKEPLKIPPASLVWGMIRTKRDIDTNTMPLKKLAEVNGRLKKGRLTFKGEGRALVRAFEERILHILEANGAFFKGSKNRGHAQRNRDIAFHTLQPYPSGRLKGLYPTITIRP